MLKPIALFCFISIVTAEFNAQATDFPLDIPDTHYCSDPTKACSYNQASAFADLSKLSTVQVNLLNGLLGNGSPVTNDQFFQWAYAHDDLASAFLGGSHALGFLQIILENGEVHPATDLLINIDHVEGDRTEYHADKVMFSRWKDSGAKFILTGADGKVEKGSFNFDTGNLGGSLHSGFDTQGYTSATKMPRIQFNYRESDGMVDIDLDAYQPWYGPIPNPHHLTWENSDIRHWLTPTYATKFGDPGYTVYLRSVAANSNQ